MIENLNLGIYEGDGDRSWYTEDKINEIIEEVNELRALVTPLDR